MQLDDAAGGAVTAAGAEAGGQGLGGGTLVEAYDAHAGDPESDP